MGPAQEQRHRAAESWQAFRAAREGGDLQAKTPAGWSVLGMLGHVAFWLETIRPFVTGAFRGDPSAFAMTFPSGYVPEMDWPNAAVHNAREAAWAEQAGPDAVIARLEAAWADAEDFLLSVDDAEARLHAGYFLAISTHLDEHRQADLTSSER